MFIIPGCPGNSLIRCFTLLQWLVYINESRTHTRPNSVIMNFFTFKDANMFPELTVKRIFCYKEGILMEKYPSSADFRRILNILLQRMTL